MGRFKRNRDGGRAVATYTPACRGQELRQAVYYGGAREVLVEVAVGEMPMIEDMLVQVATGPVAFDCSTIAGFASEITTRVTNLFAHDDNIQRHLIHTALGWFDDTACLSSALLAWLLGDAAPAGVAEAALIADTAVLSLADPKTQEVLTSALVEYFATPRRSAPHALPAAVAAARRGVAFPDETSDLVTSLAHYFALLGTRASAEVMGVWAAFASGSVTDTVDAMAAVLTTGTWGPHEGRQFQGAVDHLELANHHLDTTSLCASLATDPRTAADALVWLPWSVWSRRTPPIAFPKRATRPGSGSNTPGAS